MSRSSKGLRKGPLSVALPDELRARVATEAKRRGLKLSPAVRALVAERVEQLEDQQRLTAAEEWQRREAWATWAKAKRVRPAEASREELRAAFATARLTRK